MNVVQRVDKLRASMKKNGIDAYIIPSNDAHQSEYVADHNKCREWISGFTGSAGTVIVTQDKAGLWTDSRYFIQGEKELEGSGIDLHKPKERSHTDMLNWITKELEVGSTIGMDGDLCAIGQFDVFQQHFADHDLKFDVSKDLFDEVWEDRPSMPMLPIYELDVQYAGKSRTEKIANIRTEMKKMDVDHHLISTLDDIAWIFNIRGKDVAFNPIAICHAVISMECVTLYIQAEKVSEAIGQSLKRDGVTLRAYDALTVDLNRLPETETILINKEACFVNVHKVINCKIQSGKTISTLMKAIKNETELSHFRSVMTKDGAAIAQTFYWIEQSLKNGESITEADVADRLAENRSKMEGYVGESFPAIIGYRANGAIVHYRPYHGKCKTLMPEGILLADSGGQYIDGTTDITRTIALGTPSKEEKRNFTLVLKGNISLDRITFPKGTSGAELDTLARMHLWEHGLNYGHGTGHGVGFFLNVHEGPQGITGTSTERGRMPMMAGMVTSNEPGFYKEGAYGIRVENLIATVPSEYDGFLEFETLSLYPIDIKLIDEAIFTKKEKAWLNKYHYHVMKQVSPYLEGDVKSWFELKCRPMN